MFTEDGDDIRFTLYGMENDGKIWGKRGKGGIFAADFSELTSKKKVMEVKKTKLDVSGVDVFSTYDEIGGHLLRGRALYDGDDGRFTFVQNLPRGPRSREIGRTEHARVVVRPDGDYTVTFRIGRRTKWVKEVLIAEARALSHAIELERASTGLKIDASVMIKKDESEEGGSNG